MPVDSAREIGSRPDPEKVERDCGTIGSPERWTGDETLGIALWMMSGRAWPEGPKSLDVEEIGDISSRDLSTGRCGKRGKRAPSGSPRGFSAGEMGLHILPVTPLRYRTHGARGGPSAEHRTRCDTLPERHVAGDSSRWSTT